jgi:alpha-ketoglutarate-dependent taurine dioxygenase
VKVTRIAPIAVEVHDVDLATDMTPELAGEMEQLLRAEGVIMLRDQHLDDAGQIAFASRFGRFSQFNPEDRASFVYRVDNREGFGTQRELAFHADNMFTDYPLKYLMLYGLDVTTDGVPLAGGETVLTNCAAALDRLPARTVETLAGLECRTTTTNRGSHVRPCIQTHGVTGQPYLVISQITTEIMGVEPDAAAELLAEIERVLYDERFVYRHRWREGDLLMWDNCLVQHARAYYDNTQHRVLRRSAIADDSDPDAVAA